MKHLVALGLLILSITSHAQTPTITSTYGITGTCTGVTYGNGTYVASATLSTDLAAVFTSADAKTWTPLPSGHVPPTGFTHLAFGNGVFVGVAFPSTIYSSTDGASWTLRSSNIPGIIADIKFLQGAFYAVSGSIVTKSADGLNWAPLSLGITVPANYNFVNIDYGGGQFVIGADIPADMGTPEQIGVYRSATAASGSWTFNTVAATPPVTKLIWLKDRFYLFSGNTFVTSTDASTWAVPSPAIVDTLTDGTVGTLTDLELPAGFAAGDSVYVMGRNPTTGVYSMQVSVDGTHFKSFFASGMVANGGLFVNGLYLIYGNGGVSTSSDGIHFQFHSTSFTGLATNGSGYAAVGFGGGGGHIFTSPDFVNWTDRTPETTNGLPNIAALVYTGTKYLAAGAEKNIYTSNDGVSWSVTQADYSFQGMGYGAGRFVGAGYTDTSQGLVTSTDGVSWNMVDTNFNSYYHIRYVNSSFFALGISFRDNTGRILQSADGLTWQNITPAVSFAVAHYSDVMYDGTKYYFTGIKKAPNGDWTDFFTLSTTDPTNTASYGAEGSITNPAPGTSAGDYLTQFGDFVYHNGQYVGTVEDRVDHQAYLAYSSDGMSWTTTPLNGPEQARTIVMDGDIYRIVGDDGGRYSASIPSPLPVTLYDFEVKAVASGSVENSQLSWRTASESNSAYFLVQHSVDAVHWDSIGRVTAAGESRITASYQFTHVEPPTGTNYYRLGMTDLDGQRKWSPVRSVDIGDGGGLRVYPNPAKGMVRLQLPGAGSVNLVLYNSAGVPVRQQVVNGYSVTLDLQSLAAGIYHLVVFQGGKRYSKEFIIAE